MLKNMKISTRLSLIFTFILLLMLANGIVAIKGLGSLDAKVEELTHNRLPKIEQASSIINHINIIARGLRNLILDTSQETQQAELQRIATSREVIGKTISTLQENIKDEQGIAKLRTLIEARNAYIEITTRYFDLLKKGQYDEAKSMLLTSIRGVQSKYFIAIEDLIAHQHELAEQAAKEAAELTSRADTEILAVLITALLVSATAAFLIIRSITGPVNKAVTLAEVMAKGDLTARLDIDQNDEIGAMAKAMNMTVTNLKAMIEEIIQGIGQLTSFSANLVTVSGQLSSSAHETAKKSGAVAAAAEEMSTNVNSVSAAMEQSSSNVGLVAAATGEMTATVNEIGQSAEKAREVSESAVKQSQAASERMSSLGESAHKIGKVTETITEISEQTNLLALNATIEAARAGEAGKGFAVVANEIKELAKQTAAATVDIKNQIAEMQDTTTTTIGDIEKISNIIVEINSVIHGIATAVEEQSVVTNEIADNISQASLGISEVNENVAQSSLAISDITKNIAEIDQDTKEVEMGSSQVQGGARELSELAVRLESLMHQFRV